MITKEQASAIWNASPPRSWPDNTPIDHADPIDYGSFWHLAFEDGVFGSMGLLMDKSDGHMNWLGSGLDWETWIYTHRCGFSHKHYIWHIYAIHNPDKLVTLLRRLRYNVLALDLNKGSLQLSFSWMGYDGLNDIAGAEWIEYEFFVTECSWTGCSLVGAVIPPFNRIPIQNPVSLAPENRSL